MGHLMKLTHYRVSASSGSLANRGPSPGLESWVSEANQQTFIALALKLASQVVGHFKTKTDLVAALVV